MTRTDNLVALNPNARLHNLERIFARDVAVFRTFQSLIISALGFVLGILISGLFASSAHGVVIILALSALLPGLACWWWPSQDHRMRRMVGFGPDYRKARLDEQTILAPLLHDVLGPLVAYAGAAPVDARNLVPVHVRMIAQGPSLPNRLHATIYGHPFPGLTAQAETTLILMGALGGRWGPPTDEGVCLFVPAPNPSAHARLRWQAHIRAHPGTPGVG